MVTGTVFDAQTGRVIAGATVSVEGHSINQNRTDPDGRFTISLKPGTYALRVSAENYAEMDVADVVVKAGEVVDSSVVLTNKGLVTTVDVVERVTQVGATAEAALQERKLAPVVSDSISKEELTNGVSSDAAGALEKVTGVSVVGEGFVYVRGLGERYSSTQLNGSMIPTTEPEKRVVPLDLFPAGLIESIQIAKTYSPDLPAEFAGGLVQLRTVDFPAQKIFRVSVKSGFNTLTTFKRFLTYPSNGFDFFGFDSGSRGVPSIIPTNKRIFPGQFNAADLQTFGRAFSNNWEPSKLNGARPALDWSAVAGGTFGRVGLIGAFSFNNKPQTQRELQRYLRQGAGSPIIFTEYPDFRDYSEQARFGGVFNAAFRVSNTSRILFRNTVTHDAEKSAREFSGYDGGVDGYLSSQRLRFVERNLWSTGVEGDHALPNLANSVFHWQITYSGSSRNEPDLREVFRGLLPDGGTSFRRSALQASAFFLT